MVGLGATVVAAKKLNRRFVGCDESVDAVNTALARLAQEPNAEEDPANGLVGID